LPYLFPTLTDSEDIEAKELSIGSHHFATPLSYRQLRRGWAKSITF